MDAHSFLTFEYPSDHYIPHFSPKAVVSHGHLLKHISEQVTPLMRSITLDEMDTRRTRLKDRPLISYITLSDILSPLTAQPEFSWVLLNNVIAKPYEDEMGWAAEPQDEAGEIAQIAKNFIDRADDAQMIEAMFHERTPEKRIKMVEIMGPAGPFYYVADGVKRVAASIISGFSEIPCDVARITYPLTEKVEDLDQYYDWKKKIGMRMIKGEFRSVFEGAEEIRYLDVESEVLQWIRVTSPANIARINRAYETLYPESLKNLMIPRSTLFDGNALWKYFRQQAF